MIDWKIFYDDGTVWTNEDGPWQEAPHRGVQVLVHRDTRVGPRDPRYVGALTNTGDYYVWWPGQEWPWGCDVAGLLDYLVEVGATDETARLADFSIAFLREHGVKLGRSIGDNEFKAIFERARNDPDLPKGAKLPGKGTRR